MRYYLVDAFAARPFEGNQAGVCMLNTPLRAETMQQIAAENNLAETAFLLPDGDAFQLRWFTPAVEIALCGHATLASAYVLFHEEGYAGDTITFHTQSGALHVSRDGDRLRMDFPIRTQTPVAITDAMREAIGAPILSAYGGYNLMLELPDAQSVRALVPDIAKIKALDAYHGVIVTAPGDDCDFVSRFFAPNVGIAEDPVTGSTHTSLVPYWAARLGKEHLVARQLSRRGGTLWCTLAGDRVQIAGTACLYLKGTILLEEN